MKPELIKLLAEILECDESTLSDDTCFREHKNWDSLAHISTVAMIDERFNVVPPLEQLRTISELATYIEGQLSRASAQV
jgi:acyl carrier protein